MAAPRKTLDIVLEIAGTETEGKKTTVFAKGYSCKFVFTGTSNDLVGDRSVQVTIDQSAVPTMATKGAEITIKKVIGRIKIDSGGVRTKEK